MTSPINMTSVKDCACADPSKCFDDDCEGAEPCDFSFEDSDFPEKSKENNNTKKTHNSEMNSIISNFSEGGNETSYTQYIEALQLQELTDYNGSKH